jgi:hypothetical protein
MRRVVHEHTSGKVSTKDIQIFKVIALNKEARLSKKTMLNIFPLYDH